MTTSTAVAPAASPPRQPEMKFGPFAGGLSVAIWRNTVETEDGPRDIRSVTINPRRYKVAQSGEWRDGSYRASDVATLVLALAAAQQYMASHPLPQPAEEDPPDLPPGEVTPF